MSGWALSLRRERARALAKLHHFTDVRVAEAGARVWARGTGGDEEMGAILSRLPLSRLFEIVHRDRLRPRGRMLPTARLPDLSWVPLAEWLVLGVPSAALPGELSRSAELKLELRPRGDVLDTAEELLVCSIESFRGFLLQAPLHRLRPLRFVVNDHTSEVLVRGWPLPPVTGERFVLDRGIATPAGHGWSPPVAAGVVRSWLGLRDASIALWRADGGISEVPEDAFQSASRRAGRKL